MNTAYNQGYSAFTSNRGRNANPYNRDIQPICWQAWNDGWCDAKYTYA